MAKRRRYSRGSKGQRYQLIIFVVFIAVILQLIFIASQPKPKKIFKPITAALPAPVVKSISTPVPQAKPILVVKPAPAPLPQAMPIPPAAPLPAATGKGKIAIVIDDWGYNLKNIPIVDGIKYPLTMAILPNLPYTQEVAVELKKRGFQLILHLPTEPQEKVRLEDKTIMVGMDNARIEEIFNHDINSIPGLVGISNHMGSRATADTKTMQSLFRGLKKRELYFLDSFVSPGSVCESLAEGMHIGFAKRDVFLDNRQDANYIKGQLNKLKKIARSHASAIGIGHDRQVTLEVLREEMARMEKEGYKFVFVSELVK